METLTATRGHRPGFPQHRSLRPLWPWLLVTLVRPLQLLILAPVWLFLAMLAAMLLRPPDLPFYNLDRIALAFMVCSLLLRHLLLHQPIVLPRLATLPMLGLLLLSCADLLSHPFDQQAWSVLASKWAAPFILYLLAGIIFDHSLALHKLETFNLIVLAYLIVIAILFLAGATALIFPPFILDESLGIHADRARGPFLQAVANGLALNLLGLLAFDSFRRQRIGLPLAAFFLLALPLAIVATKTRAVWLSFVASAVALVATSPSRRVRRVSLTLAVVAIVGTGSALALLSHHNSLLDRLQEKSPVEFRMAVYQAGWEMFLKKPVQGWGFEPMQRELTRRISEFHQRQFFFHNTYLEIAVQHGLLGFTLYVWLIFDLFRLGRFPQATQSQPDHGFMDAQFRSLWPLLLLVYFLNASFVVMNYQFVNGLLFTLAGILAAQNRRASYPPAQESSHANHRLSE